jgi:hypothetical protein
MMERLCRSPTISFARERTARCADMVFGGTSNKRASSPAGTPSGSRATNSRNVSSRVDWASAAKAAMISISSMYPEYQIYGCMQDDSMPVCFIPVRRGLARRATVLHAFGLGDCPDKGRYHSREPRARGRGFAPDFCSGKALGDQRPALVPYVLIHAPPYVRDRRGFP